MQNLGLFLTESKSRTIEGIKSYLGQNKIGLQHAPSVNNGILIPFHQIRSLTMGVYDIMRACTLHVTMKLFLSHAGGKYDQMNTIHFDVNTTQ